MKYTFTLEVLTAQHTSLAHNRSHYTVCECKQVISCIKVTQVVIAITLTPVRHSALCNV